MKDFSCRFVMMLRCILITSIMVLSAYAKHLRAQAPARLQTSVVANSGSATQKPMACPFGFVTFTATNALGAGVTNGQTIPCNAPSFTISANSSSGNYSAPCITTSYTNYSASLGSNGTENLYEGGTYAACIGPAAGCAFPIGGGTALAGSTWSLIWYGLNPNQQHDFTFCRSGTINTTTVTLQDCWTGAPITAATPNPITFSTANPPTTASCLTVTIPAGTAIGTATYTINPASASGALTNFNNGDCRIDPSVLAAGTYTVGYVFTPPPSLGCPPVTGNFTFTIGPNITAAATSVSVCAGSSATLTATSSGGTGTPTFSWTPAAGLSASTGSAVTLSPAASTTYTVTARLGGCTASATSTVTVNQPPVVSVNSPTVCAGTSATLTATGASSYSWQPAATLSAGTGSVVTTAPVTGATGYTVTGSTAGCSSSAIATITTITAPTVSVNSASVCSGNSAVLTATGASSYTWSPATSLSSANGATVSAMPAVTTIYTVTGGASACTSSALATVSVVGAGISVTPSNALYCPGASPVSLTASGAATYTWTPAAGLSSTGTASTQASPSVTTTYTVLGAVSGCTASALVTVTVAPPPGTVTVVSSSSVICQGTGSATLTAGGASGYTWSPASGLSGTTSSVVVASPAATTTYSVSGTNSFGCSMFPAVFTLSVSPAIIPAIAASGNSVCVGDTLILTASPTGAGMSYTWAPASGISGSVNASAAIGQFTTPGTMVYTVTVSDGQCQGSQTYTVTSTVCQPPLASFSTQRDSICAGDCVTYTNTTSSVAPASYQWFFPGGTPPTSNLKDPNVCYNSPGNYTVTLIATNPYGSDTISDYLNVTQTPTVIASADTTIKIGQHATISVTGGSSFSWSPKTGLACPSCSVTVASPTVTTTYTVTSFNSPYCKSYDTLTIHVDFVCGDFFVPNAFSPNGDGLNEEVNVHGVCISTFVLQIFNRWGELIFETTDKTLGWNGSFRGKPMDTGVFVYRVTGMTVEQKPFDIKGTVTLLR